MDRRAFLRTAALAPAAIGATGCALDDIVGTANAVRVAVSWSAAELQAFRSVLEGLSNQSPPPRYRVDPVPLGDQIDAALAARGPSRPDVVMLPRPGLVGELIDKLVPLPASVWDLSSDPYAPIWRKLLVTDEPYGVPFKAAHKSLVWYRKSAFPDVPTFDDLNTDRQLALAAGDGWMLTDFFENILHSVSREKYRALRDPAEPRDWDTDEIRTSFDLLGTVWGAPNVLAGGVERSMALQFPDAVREVFRFERAAMVVAPDFAEPFVNEVFSTRHSDEVGVMQFPRLRDTDEIPHVAGGDVAVVTSDRPDAIDLVRRLANPSAAEPWVYDRGGFIPVHRDSEMPYTAGFSELIEPLRDGTVEFDFDLSDQIGGAGGWEGLWRVLRDFLAKVGDGRADRRQSATDDAIADLQDVEATVRAGAVDAG